jgi:ammonia channel protein AmtB
MLIFTGFYAFYGACLVIVSTSFPGWATIYLSPTTLGTIAMVITMGFAGGFTGGYFGSRGDPFWTVSGGLAGVISVSAGADVYAPTLAYLIAMVSAFIVPTIGDFIEKKMRVDDVVGAVAVHGSMGFLALFWVGIFAAGYPTGVNNVDSSIWGQLLGVATFLPLGFLSGWVASFILKKLNLLRVPPEVELMGLDVAEYEPLIYLPEVAHAPEMVVEPDGTIVPAEPVLRMEEASIIANGNGRGPRTDREVVG